jgi:hypothetical protein
MEHLVHRLQRLSVVLALCTPLVAQELLPPDTIDVEPQYWRHALGTSLTFSQVSFSDWAQGGEDSYAYGTSAVGTSTYDWHPITWATTYRLGFGQTRIGGRETRKTEDKIDLESVITYRLGITINPYAALTVKTQFATGYRYDKAGNRTPISWFFDPAFLTQSLGLGFQVTPELRSRFGFALREIVTSQYISFADDPKTTEVEKVKIEDGLESVTEGTWKLDHSTTLNAKLELFSSFREPEKVIVRGENTLTVRLARLVTLVVNVQVINERRVTPRTQLKQSLGVGISYVVL